MAAYAFGDVVLVPFPFTDQSTTKRRPAVVVSSAAYQRERPDLILMAVTSQIRPAAGLGELTVRDWQAAGLLKPSAIKPVLTTVERGLVIRRLGRLKDQDREALKQAIQAIQAILG
jgi:mRNA interferase MazF